MAKENIKKLEETKEGGRIKMIKSKKRNNINSTSCNDSSTFNISRSKYKFNIR